MMNHYFHLVLDEDTIRFIMTICGVTTRKEISRLLRFIFRNYYYRIEKLHFKGKNQGNKYEFLNPNLKVPRKSIWFTIDEALYARMQKVKGDLRFFSVGATRKSVFRLSKSF